MRDVRYKYHGAIGPSSWTHSSLVEFLFAIPYLFPRVGKEPIPPLHVLNELLMSGVSDAGMSGGCEWKAFEIDQAEYDELVEELTTMPNRELVLDSELASCRDLKQWRAERMTKYFSRRNRGAS